MSVTAFNENSRVGQAYRAPVRRHGRFGLVGMIFVIAIVYGAIAATNPWALHIGEHWTPLMYWTGTGKLVTSRGTYPLYLSLWPASHFSHLRLDGVRPTGGVQGSGSLCTAPGVTENLKLSGTIYGGWRSTDGALMDLRLLEYKALDLGGKRNGYFNLYGKWNGPELVMDDRGEPGHIFYSGLKIEHASVTLNWASYSDFKAMCAKAGNPAPQR
ncbi:MAG TPA: hypothetical protein VFU27_04490 [Terriglobales bacterium]|nr:hypothetical protein [Terriglobales bacterium]